MHSLLLFCVYFVLLYMGNIEFKIDSKNDSKFDSKNDSKLHIRPLSCIYVEYAISTWNEIAHIEYIVVI
jgi:hypothetical protein